LRSHNVRRAPHATSERQPLERRINRFAIKGELAEEALMHVTKRLRAYERLQAGSAMFPHAFFLIRSRADSFDRTAHVHRHQMHSRHRGSPQ
jgi:hypothetical protein